MQTANNAQAATAAKYQVVNGTSYHAETPQEVINVLERVYRGGGRIRVHYGDRKTGRDWLDVYDVTGTIGRSTGKNPIPLMIHNSRSTGGPHILDHCIIKIKGTDGILLYKQANYQDPKPEAKRNTDPETRADYPWIVEAYGELFSRHKSERSANMTVKSLS